MRQKRRIPIILKVLKDDKNKTKLLEFWFKQKKDQTSIDDPIYHIKELVEKWNKNYLEIKNFWENSPDLRLAQVLIIKRILFNTRGFWYIQEDEILMAELKFLEPREILFWDKNYDADMNELKETEYILIKNMDTNHIEKILNSCVTINDLYKNTFIKELNIRKPVSDKIENN